MPRAARKSPSAKAAPAKRKGGKRTLPLDDPRWLSEYKALRRMKKRGGKRLVAIIDLQRATMSGRLRLMRRYILHGEETKRELVPPELLAREPLLSANLDRYPPDHRSIRGWLYYVWEPDLEKLLGAEPRSEDEADDDSPSTSRRGSKAAHDWPGHVSRHVAQEALANRRMPTTPEMLQWCIDKWDWQPDRRQMEKLLKGLRPMFG